MRYPQTIDEAAELAEVRQLIRTGAGRAVRLGRGLSYGEAAHASGVSVAAIWRWEHGTRVPSGEPALRYGRLLCRLMEQGR